MERTFAKGAKYDFQGEEGRIEGMGLSHFRQTTATRMEGKRTGSAMVEADNSTKFVYDASAYYPPMINHIWTDQEIRKCIEDQSQYAPKSFSDKTLQFLVKRVLYGGFNWLSGFNYEDPSPQACALRLILLESIAGVPGMVAAVCRHFTSLRTLRRDHGWIHTLLEEAQNERMHLLVCLKQFEAGLGTRAVVCVAQYVLVPIMTAAYIVSPRLLHRFVGYLEETAVKTYSDLLRISGTPGSKLHKAWGGGGPGGVPAPAPKLAIAYWKLEPDATWRDVLAQLLADESHHRDVNHTFADMERDEPNPFLQAKIQDLEAYSANRGFRAGAE